MGCGTSVEAERNKQIEAELNETKKVLSKEIKLLLLGAGESGKSTLAKQMKILHLNGYTDDEKQKFKPIIFNNCVSSMRTLCIACNHLGIEPSPANKAAVTKVCEGADYQFFNGSFTAEMAAEIKMLWADPGIQACFERAAEFQLLDSAAYYFKNVDRLVQPNYIPSDEDVLRCRIRTTGIHEIAFTDGPFTYKRTKKREKEMDSLFLGCHSSSFRCGYQASKRSLYWLTVSEYDLRLYEDDTTNRMTESLKLFKEICNTPWFTDASMILFFNKRDIFQEKIVKSPLKICFPEYDGPNKPEEASDYIRKQFLDKNQSKRAVYTHLTCATDTNVVRQLFNDEIVIKTVQAKGGVGA